MNEGQQPLLGIRTDGHYDPSQSLTVYARVLLQTTPTAGTYVDTVIATITY